MKLRNLLRSFIAGLCIASTGLLAGTSTITVLDSAGATKTYGVVTQGSGNFVGEYVLCDQAAAANCATVASNALSVNAAQINGVTPLMGNGTTGTGSARVTISSDNSAVAGVGAAATAGAVPANAIYLGAQGSAVLKGMTMCDTHAFYDASDNGKKTVVAGVSAKKIYVCGYLIATGGTATNVSLTSGTGTDCVTTSVAITPAYQLLANDKAGFNSAFWNGLITLANAENLCVNASAANSHQVEVWYTIQ